MTAERLYQIVKDHPEAWPERVRFSSGAGIPRHNWGFYRQAAVGFCDATIETEIAVLAFEASGMRRLTKLVGPVGFNQRSDDSIFEVDWDCGNEFAEGESPVEAIYAAIAAVKGADHAT